MGDNDAESYFIRIVNFHSQNRGARIPRRYRSTVVEAEALPSGNLNWPNHLPSGYASNQVGDGKYDIIFLDRLRMK